MPAVCAGDNTQTVEQDNFWSTIESGGKLQPHQIGWIIAGGCAVVTVLVTLVGVIRHSINYNKPAEQRQILRILYMPAVFAVISFFSYRYFREYTYYELIQIIYEAFTISAFFLLIVEFVASTASDNLAESAIARKDKKALPIPFCCLRYRPTKAYFMYTIKWAVLQYVIVRPLVSIAGIITNALGLYCESGGYNPHFAYAYLEAVDFISISITLYGLIVFYGLTREELKGRKPLAKFLAIKLIIFFTFYQSFVFSVLEKIGKIKASTYWTQTNVANGLNALCICVEMVFFSLFMLWAYPAGVYYKEGKGHTNPFPAIVDSLNFSDFAVEIYKSLRYFFRAAFCRPNPVPPPSRIETGDENETKLRVRPPLQNDFDSAFGIARGPYNQRSRIPRSSGDDQPFLDNSGNPPSRSTSGRHTQSNHYGTGKDGDRRPSESVEMSPVDGNGNGNGYGYVPRSQQLSPPPLQQQQQQQQQYSRYDDRRYNHNS